MSARIYPFPDLKRRRDDEALAQRWLEEMRAFLHARIEGDPSVPQPDRRYIRQILSRLPASSREAFLQQLAAI